MPLCPLVDVAGALQVAGMAVFRSGLFHPVSLINYQEGDSPAFCIRED